MPKAPTHCVGALLHLSPDKSENRHLSHSPGNAIAMPVRQTPTFIACILTKSALFCNLFLRGKEHNFFRIRCFFLVQKHNTPLFIFVLRTFVLRGKENLSFSGEKSWSFSLQTGKTVICYPSMHDGLSCATLRLSFGVIARVSAGLHPPATQPPGIFYERWNHHDPQRRKNCRYRGKPHPCN